jgi:ribosomal protein S18 acetylase RimI-like enzyme
VSELVIRRATVDDAEAIARTRIDGWRASYRGLIPDAYLDSMDVHASRALWEKILSVDSPTASVVVAAKDADIVGFAAGNILSESKQGLEAELTGIYVRREFQRAGIGHLLLGAVLADLRAQHPNGLIVWVLAGNKPARAFYERLGAEPLIEQTFQWDGMDLVEAAYGWRDLDALAFACAHPTPPRNAVLQ